MKNIAPRNCAGSETSMGPDFVSTVEELFCDMEEREVWPLCSTQITNGCLDMDTKAMWGVCLTARDAATRRIRLGFYT
jgi:hypothetical protein